MTGRHTLIFLLMHVVQPLLGPPGLTILYTSVKKAMRHRQRG